MSFIGVGDVFKCAQLVHRLYDFGWSKVNNATTQYLEFGQDVWRLYENLLQLDEIFKSVQRSAAGPIPMNSSFFDTSSLNTILDEPFTTIQECQVVLERRKGYAQNSGPYQNIRWNATIEQDVTKLHKKIIFHNIKILALLKPLEMKLLLDIQSLVTHYGEQTLRKLEDLERRLFGDCPTDPTEIQVASRCDLILIPEYVSKAFEAASRKTRPDIQPSNMFPLREGINAFLIHWEDNATTSTFSGGFILTMPTQSPEQYLKMMKTIWIIQCIQASQEYIESCRRGNRLLKCFVEDLAQKCVDQFIHFSEQPPGNPYKARIEPSETELAPLGHDAFAIWPRESKDLDRFEQASLDTLKMVLRAPLAHMNPSRQIEMLLLRHDTKILEMIIKETSEGNAWSDSKSRNIDLELVSLVPHYADPLNTTGAARVGLYTMGASGPDDLLNFRTFPDLLRFQEAITGYRPVIDHGKVEITIHQDRQTKYAGRVQIWNFQKNSSGMPSLVSPSSPNLSLSRRQSATPSGLSASPSAYSASFASLASAQQRSSQYSASSTPSFQSSASQISKMTSLTERGCNMEIEGHLFDVPREPLLVLFLRPKQTRAFGTSNLIVMKIPIGKGSAILDTTSCQCRGSQRNVCPHSCVTGHKKIIGSKPLLAAKYDEDEIVNLAEVGAFYRGDGEPKRMDQKLTYVRFNFEQSQHKMNFENYVLGLQRVFEGRKDMYQVEKTAVRFQQPRD